jgi:ribose transport system ATP-binding protein
VRDHGDCVIMIDHDMDIVMSMADRISILRDGEYIATVDKNDVDADKLKTLMVGRAMDGKYYRTDWGPSLAADVALKMENVSVPGQLENVSLELHNGEILGIGGLSECGMHEVGKALFGASYERTGSVTMADGTEINDINVAIDHGIAYTSKDRDKESLLINDSIADNITLPSLRDYGKIITSKKINEEADKYAKQMSTKMVGVSQFVSALSGGNKQKVVIARWLAKGSNILLLDSPTRGIDIKVKADIYNLLDEMRQQGKAILIISEEIAELMGMCDRIIIMKDRKIETELKRDPNLTDTDIIKYMI